MRGRSPTSTRPDGAIMGGAGAPAGGSLPDPLERRERLVCGNRRGVVVIVVDVARYRRCRMVTEGPAEVLHGRREEREALDRLLEAVRGGQSRVLVVCGEPGVGKTALLESAIVPRRGSG